MSLCARPVLLAPRFLESGGRMSACTKYRIVDWQTTQHYKDRNPPWIKLYKEILHTYWWVMLDDAGRALAVACMLIASENGNRGEFLADPEFLLKRAFIRDANFKPLLDAGFLEPVNAGEAEAEPESETERESDTETDRKSLAGASKPLAGASKSDPAFDEFWDAFGKKVGRGQALKSWKAATKKADPAEIIAGVKAQQGCRQWADGYQPNPSTWLNQERWADDVEALNGNKNGSASAKPKSYMR